MKNVVLLVAILALTFSQVNAQNVKKLDEKNGFKELTLGSSHESIKKYLAEAPVNSDAKEKTAAYPVTDESFFSVGESEFDKIMAVFFSDKLQSIVIETKGLQNFKDLLDALTKGYGKGEKRNTYIEEYHWEGKKVMMSYKMNGATKDGKLTITSKEISALSEKHNKNVKKGVVNEL